MAEYSVAAKVAAHTAFRDLLDAGAGVAKLRIYDDENNILYSRDMQDPCGTVSLVTGVLTFNPHATAMLAVGTGEAFVAKLLDTAGVAQLTLPCVAGNDAVPGYCVINTLSIVNGGSVELQTIQIGA